MFGYPEHSRKAEEYFKFFFFLVGPLFGPWMGPNLAGFNEAREARGARLGRVQAPENNPFSKRAEFGLRVLARGSGPGIEKSGPNPTRCHS